MRKHFSGATKKRPSQKSVSVIWINTCIKYIIFVIFLRATNDCGGSMYCGGNFVLKIKSKSSKQLDQLVQIEAGLTFDVNIFFEVCKNKKLIHIKVILLRLLFGDIRKGVETKIPVF